MNVDISIDIELDYIEITITDIHEGNIYDLLKTSGFSKGGRGCLKKI